MRGESEAYFIFLADAYNVVWLRFIYSEYHRYGEYQAGLMYLRDLGPR